MEQKTEASQAVDEHKSCPFCGTAPRYLAKQEGIYCELVICDTCGLGLAPSNWNRRAALKAQPAPIDPYQLDDDDDARFPNDTNVVILHIDRYWNLRGCEDICAALDAKPAPTEAPTYTCTLDGGPCGMGGYCKDCHAPTEAAQGALSANPNLTTSGVTCQPVAAQGNTSNNSSSSQLSGNTGELGNKQLFENIEELQPSGNTGELAQDEDSARLIAMLVDRDTPPDNRRDVIDHDIRGNPITREMVARASAETGGVKS